MNAFKIQNCACQMVTLWMEFCSSCFQLAYKNIYWNEYFCRYFLGPFLRIPFLLAKLYYPFADLVLERWYEGSGCLGWITKKDGVSMNEFYTGSVILCFSGFHSLEVLFEYEQLGLCPWSQSWVSTSELMLMAPWDDVETQLPWKGPGCRYCMQRTQTCVFSNILSIWSRKMTTGICWIKITS